MPVIRSLEVTSNAGFLAFDPFGAMLLPPMYRTSLSLLSSMGML